MIIVTKSWKWDNTRGRIKSANLCMFIMALGQVVGGLGGVLTLGFFLPQLDLTFMMWNLRSKL